jgi:hypothetical protein
MQTASSPEAKESAEDTVGWSGCGNTKQNFINLDGTQQSADLDKETHGNPIFTSEARHTTPNKSYEMLSTGSKDENEDPSDVAAAIEDLLAQTIKVCLNELFLFDLSQTLKPGEELCLLTNSLSFLIPL